MRFVYFILLMANITYAQEAIHNYGNLKVHDSEPLGLHLNLINNGNFDDNTGLVGLYGYEKSITISGAFSPIFFDLEIDADYGVKLETPIHISNNCNFISGDIITTKNQSEIYQNFTEQAFYLGENQVSKIDGYAAMTNKEHFTFPVGNQNKLRPLTISSAAINIFTKCAYFNENYKTSSTLTHNFESFNDNSNYLKISEKEFWHLESIMPSTITLTWDKESNIELLVDYISDLKVVGWSKSKNKWINLGNTSVNGSVDSGFLTSEVFTPDDFVIITIGGNNEKLQAFEQLELGNYFLTPNNDGKNDFLVIEGIEHSKNNSLQIFDRNGLMVYSKANYKNEFNGISNNNTTIAKKSGLPSGVYFYIITLHDLQQKHQGYLYLTAR